MLSNESGALPAYRRQAVVPLVARLREERRFLQVVRETRGRRVETAVGAHLAATADRDIKVTWWREGDREVDYVLADRSRVLAIEVAGGRRKSGVPGLSAFDQRFGPARALFGA